MTIAKLFTTEFKISKEKLKELGVFDALLDEDSSFFINIKCLKECTIPEFGRVYRRTYNVTALFDNVFTILEYIDSCETSSPIIYKKGRKGNDIKSGTAEYT